MAERESEVAAIEALRAKGFTGSFVAGAGTLHLLDGGRTFRPNELTIREYERFEGVSDPDDLSIVYAIEGRDGTKGTLVDAFGVYASPAIASVLEHVKIQRRATPP
ncbi:MAG TPA: phosphoribosylpyrophosphate synthetase [Methylomirabilota bacterium]|jgi:hypothetical protein|nr:phosphoribosylpyrophosphate synthetase [Methylomirabilota bacterium]